MQIVDLPTVAVEKETDKGTKILVFPCKLSLEGQIYDWELNAGQVSRIFTKTDKATNAITWEGKSGDIVNVWYATPKGAGKYPYYAAEPAEDGNVNVATTATEMFSATPSKPAFVKTGGFRKTGEKVEWDGTPRQSSFRQGLAGMMQAILSNPNINPLDKEHRNLVREIADEEVEYVRIHAKELEQSVKD